jgi:hypothetical protein
VLPIRRAEEKRWRIDCATRDHEATGFELKRFTVANDFG